MGWKLCGALGDYSSPGLLPPAVTPRDKQGWAFPNTQLRRHSVWGPGGSLEVLPPGRLQGDFLAQAGVPPLSCQLPEPHGSRVLAPTCRSTHTGDK